MYQSRVSAVNIRLKKIFQQGQVWTSPSVDINVLEESFIPTSSQTLFQSIPDNIHQRKKMKFLYTDNKTPKSTWSMESIKKKTIISKVRSFVTMLDTPNWVHDKLKSVSSKNYLLLWIKMLAVCLLFFICVCKAFPELDSL